MSFSCVHNMLSLSNYLSVSKVKIKRFSNVIVIVVNVLLGMNVMKTTFQRSDHGRL